MSGRWARAALLMRTEGVGHALRRIAQRALAPAVEVGGLTFFERDLEGELPEQPPPAGFVARQATPAELAAVRAGSDPGRAPETLRDRFRRGHLCFVVTDAEGRVAHSRWVTADPARVPELGRDLLLPPGYAYFYDGYTRSDARRLGLDGVMRSAICRALAARGFRRVISYVRTDNPAGLRAAARWQRPLGTVRYLRAGRGAPWVKGADRLAPLALSPPSALAGEAERAARLRSWGSWFQDWLARPLASRSTGFGVLPDAYFAACAEFVASTLALEPGRDALLDVGCASGGVTRGTAARARAVVGVDATLGLLAAAPRLQVRAASGAAAGRVAADGRRLPFRAGAFVKVSCVSVIHTLAELEDAVAVVRELVRVCRPGGRVLVGGLPDRRRRWAARAELWRRGSLRARLEVVAGVLLPRPLRRALARWSGRPTLTGLEFDLRALAGRLADLDAVCREVPFPPDFWSRDFRRTRSNLVVELPPVVVAAAPLPAPAARPLLRMVERAPAAQAPGGGAAGR